MVHSSYLEHVGDCSQADWFSEKSPCVLKSFKGRSQSSVFITSVSWEATFALLAPVDISSP